MANNRTPLKAWVRYDYNKMMVPGSIIYRRTKPGGNYSHYRELIDPNPNPCCPLPPTPTETCGGGPYWESRIDWNEDPLGPYTPLYTSPGAIALDSGCNWYVPLSPDQNSNYPTSENPYPSGILTKLDSNGNLVWQKAFFWNLLNETRTSDWGYSESTMVDGDGNIISNFWIVGQSELVEGQPNMLIVKTDPSGNLLWYKFYNLIAYKYAGVTTGPSELYECVVDSSNNIYVTGGYIVSRPVGGAFDQNLYILKVSGTDGSIIAEKKYPLTSPDITENDNKYGGYNITIDKNDNIYANIQGTANNNTSYLYAIAKIDTGLNVVWHKTFVFPQTGVANFYDAIQVDESGDIYLGCAQSYGSARGSAIAKLSGVNGDVIWSKFYQIVDPLITPGNEPSFAIFPIINKQDNNLYFSFAGVAGGEVPSLNLLGPSVYRIGFGKMDGSTGATINWAYLVDSNLEYMDWYYGNIARGNTYLNNDAGIAILYGTSILSSYDPAYSGDAVTLFKMPFENIAPGTVGPNTFYDITSFFTVTEYPLSTLATTLTANTVTEMTTTNSPLTYGDYTVMSAAPTLVTV